MFCPKWCAFKFFYSGKFVNVFHHILITVFLVSNPNVSIFIFKHKPKQNIYPSFIGVIILKGCPSLTPIPLHFLWLIAFLLPLKPKYFLACLLKQDFPIPTDFWIKKKFFPSYIKVAVIRPPTTRFLYLLFITESNHLPLGFRTRYSLSIITTNTLFTGGILIPNQTIPFYLPKIQSIILSCKLSLFITPSRSKKRVKFSFLKSTPITSSNQIFSIFYLVTYSNQNLFSWIVWNNNCFTTRSLM